MSIQNLKNTKVILASASPRRKELISNIVENFEVIVSDVEEVITKIEPKEIVMELAELKAGSVYEMVVDSQNDFQINDTNANNSADFLVIGADTVVVCDEKILGKPRDEKEAKAMLKMLSGREHQVYTGVCIKGMVEGKETQKSFYEATDVYISDMTDEEIDEYVASGDPFDKAGGYGIQTQFSVHVEKINGDYNNVVGFPVAKVYKELKNMLVKTE